jgi:hypothetical protein
MAAATAEVTSIPGVLAPELAARIELMSIAGVVGVVDDKSVFTAETELIASTYFRDGATNRTSLWNRIVHP